MSDAVPVPCRICGCIEGEPGFCHACYRDPYVPFETCYRLVDADLCHACWEWLPAPGCENHGDPLVDAARAELRAQRAEWAASRRGSSVPGAAQLRWHAARLRVKARRWRRDLAPAGEVIA